MSTSAGGKFQDHYSVLGVEPKSDSEVIHRAYSALAARFHPDNELTRDKARFAAVTLAYEVLSDPEARAVFDAIRRSPGHESAPQFGGTKFFDAIVSEAARRMVILCVLYDRRQQKPFTPSLAVRQLEVMLTVSLEEMNFTLWYLKQRGLVKADDTSSLLITVEGMDYLEKNLPSIDTILPFLKPAGRQQP
ncbi:MAG: DnaJ domain-containing protein [Bryobacterales bacterium]|nr:DnaJ domain-containing protein [Bryobacterales bacterium]